MRILLVESGQPEAPSLAGLFAENGHVVDLADSGEIALACLAASEPDAVVADIVMPGIDGFELCARIKSLPRPTAIPVMLVTGRGDIRHVFRALAAGADNVVTRPHEDGQLLARLSRMVAARHGPVNAPVRAEVDGESFLLPKGPQAWIEVLVSSLEDGARTEAVLREREAMLEVERQRAEAANRAKDEFLGVVSHELRTPMTAVLGWVHLLRRGTVPEEERPAALARLERSAQAQAYLIEDLLDSSRIVHGRFRIERTSIDLLEIASTAVAALAPTAALRDTALTLIHEPGPYAMHGDARRLGQVIWNLIQNGLKSTASGGKVDVSLRHSATEGFEIRVQDDGRGIAPALLPHVFERFRQNSAEGDRAPSGLGLGLSIVKHLAEAHGGGVSVASDGPGRGAVFVVTLPKTVGTVVVDEPGATDGGSEIGDTLARINVLLCEPDAGVRQALLRMLQAERATVVAVESIDAAANAVREHSIDVILSGAFPTEGPGENVLAALRAAGCNAPAVALTSEASPSARASAFTAGFADHLSRPVDSRDLVDTLARLARPTASRTEPPRS